MLSQDYFLDTFLDFFIANSLMISLESSSHKMSDSRLIIVRFTRRFCVIDVRNLFSINFSFEKERSPLQFVTIRTRYIRRAISMFGKVSCTPLSNTSLYRKSSVLTSVGSSSVNMLANVTNWHSSSLNVISKSSGYDLMSCSAASQSSSEESLCRCLKKTKFT